MKGLPSNAVFHPTIQTVGVQTVFSVIMCIQYESIIHNKLILEKHGIKHVKVETELSENQILIVSNEGKVFFIEKRKKPMLFGMMAVEEFINVKLKNREND